MEVLKQFMLYFLLLSMLLVIGHNTQIVSAADINISHPTVTIYGHGKHYTISSDVTTILNVSENNLMQGFHIKTVQQFSVFNYKSVYFR